MDEKPAAHYLNAAGPVVVAVALLLFAPACEAAYRIDIEAPRVLRRLLDDFLDLSRYHKREDLSPEQIDLMIARTPDQVARLAATEGYFSTRTTVTTETNDGNRLIRVAVDAGEPTKVAGVAIDVGGDAARNAPDQAARIRREWPLKTGEVFRQEEWATAKQHGLQILQQRRYPAATIAASEARIRADDHAADLSVQYDSGPAFHFGEVEVSGTQRYPDSIIRNLNPLRTGEEYRAERLLEFQRQLMRTPYFSNAVIDIDRTPATAARAPVRVQVTEFPEQRVRAAAGYTTDTGAHLEGIYSRNNMFDRAWVLESQLRLEQRRQLGALELSAPPRPGGFIDNGHASYERSTLEGIELRSRRAGLRRARHTERRDLSYTLEYYRDELTELSGGTVPAEVVTLPGTHQALVAGIAKTRRQVDNPVFPRRGRVIDLQAGVAVKGVLTDQTFVRLYGRAREFLPVGRRDVVILRAEAGAVVSKGGNAAIPATLLFRAGGTDSVRGYAFQSIGNKVGGTVYPTRFLATGSAEYQHWLNERWGAAVFYDVGTAADRWSNKQLFQAVGAGVRWRSPVGTINADLAYGLRDHTIRPHLSLGVVF